jgi:hypothetical protein
MKFTEAKLEAGFIALLAQVGIPNELGLYIVRVPDEVLVSRELRLGEHSKQNRKQGCSGSN